MHLIELFLDECYREISSDVHWKGTHRSTEGVTPNDLPRVSNSGILRAILHVADRHRTHGHRQDLHGGAVSERTDRHSARPVRRSHSLSFPPLNMSVSRVFSGHVRTLAEQLDPNHQKLRIQRLYQRECPWPSAQAELRLINAYKVASVSSSNKITEGLLSPTALDSSRQSGVRSTVHTYHTKSHSSGVELRCRCRRYHSDLDLRHRQSQSSESAVHHPVGAARGCSTRCRARGLHFRYVQDLYSSRLTDEESYFWTMFVSGVKFVHEMI